MNEPTDDELHALGDVIEHVQTMWEADRDQHIEPLAEFTARGIFAAGYRLDVVAEEPEWEYGVIGPTGRMVNNGDYTIQQTHRRRKAGRWVPVKQEGAGREGDS